MSAKEKILLHSRGSARHFLFSKTDTNRLKNLETLEVVGVDDTLKSVFPNISSGKTFLEDAIQQLDSADQFTAMVIRMDPAAQNKEHHGNPDITAGRVEVAKILNATVQKENGLWGTLEPGLFGCFLPGKNGSEGLEIARNFQKSLSENTRETVTVGLACYPTMTYRKLEIVDNARKALDHASFLGPNSAVVFDGVSLNISGDKHYEKGDIDAAVEEFKKALILDPSNVNVHNSLGVCYGLRGDYDKAKEAFHTAVSLDPREYMALYNIGLVHLLTGHRDQALDFFLKAHAINADVHEVAFQTGKLYLELNDPQKCRLYLEHAAELEPESAAVYRYLGDCYAAEKMADSAIAAYKKAIKLNPSDAASLSALGCLFDDQGENPEIALMFCRESVALAPENGLFRYRLGRLYHRQNRFDDAIKELKKAKRLGYADADANELIEAIQNQRDQKSQSGECQH